MVDKSQFKEESNTYKKTSNLLKSNTTFRILGSRESYEISVFFFLMVMTEISEDSIGNNNWFQSYAVAHSPSMGSSSYCRLKPMEER
jgi:hypothetical protein